MGRHYPFDLQPLPYAYDALAPFIDETTLHFHHDKHLQTYVDNLNKALEPFPNLHQLGLTELLLCPGKIPEKSRVAVHNNAGGVFNHELYFNCMGPNRQDCPQNALVQAICEQFGSLDLWKEEMTSAGLSQFGSGWAWLVADRRHCLQIIKTANQDTPLPAGVCPIMLVDVWEHAYYLQYQNRRAEYLDNWFHTINWDYANRQFGV